MKPREAAKWVEAQDYCQRNRSVPAVLAAIAAKKYKPALAALMDKKPAIRFPRGKDPKKEKKALHAECEALCKALVFWRDCGDWHLREGICFTCGKHTTLQWGHFLPREKAPELRYSVEATAGQCGGCNGPGHGEPLKYADAIDKRDGAGRAGALVTAYYKKRWVWNKTTLTAERNKLIRACQEKRIDVDKVLRRNPEPSSQPTTPTNG